MKTALERKFENLNEILEKLSREKAPIIVEGKKDAIALQKLGISAPIIRIKASRRPLPDQLANIRGEEVIILTDFDRRGLELAKRIVFHLERSGVKSNMVYWKKIGNMVKRDVQDVEGLYNFLEGLRLRLSP